MEGKFMEQSVMYEKYFYRHLRKLYKREKVMDMSKKWKFDKKDAKRVLRNALIFLAPVAIVEIELLQRGAKFEELTIAFQVWILGVALDFFRKLQAGK
jgi:hypothetical protein